MLVDCHICASFLMQMKPGRIVSCSKAYRQSNTHYDNSVCIRWMLAPAAKRCGQHRKNITQLKQLPFVCAQFPIGPTYMTMYQSLAGVSRVLIDDTSALCMQLSSPHDVWAFDFQQLS